MGKIARLSRRIFLQSAATAAGAVAVPQLIPAGVLGAPGKPGPNERVTLGVIGVHFRGPQLIQVMPGQGRVLAISDCYGKRMDEALAKLSGPKLATYQDYRRMFDGEIGKLKKGADAEPRRADRLSAPARAACSRRPRLGRVSVHLES